MARVPVCCFYRQLLSKQKTRFVVGIDPGTECGFSVLEFDVKENEASLVCSGTWNLSREKHEGGGMQMVRLEVAFRDLIKRVCDVSCTYMAFELNRFIAERVEGGRRVRAGPDAQQFYGGVKNLLMKMCEEMNIPYVGIPPGTIKKQVTGKGNTKKETVKKYLENFLGQKFDGKLDETDAIACAFAFIGLERWQE